MGSLRQYWPQAEVIRAHFHQGWLEEGFHRDTHARASHSGLTCDHLLKKSVGNAETHHQRVDEACPGDNEGEMQGLFVDVGWQKDFVDSSLSRLDW